MLDLLPENFWQSPWRPGGLPNRVLEPCAGKGVFLCLMMERFLKGLERQIPDLQERRKYILENILYFADINPLNIFICKLLLDPKDEFELNYYQGDSMNLDCKKTFNVVKFNLIIGNPPYSTNPSLPSSKPLYNLFTENFIDQCLHFLLHPRDGLVAEKGWINLEKICWLARTSK